MSACTCPPAVPGAIKREGDKDCPEHGLAAIMDELDGRFLYVLDDGFECFARTKADAERCRDRTTKARA